MPEHFLGLEALIVSGHPGRQVGRLVLGEGPDRRTLYLKREQGVRWTTRLLNFLSGFGWVSRSVREAQLLEALERDGLPGPRWLATGEDANGRAFLLVEEVRASVLADGGAASPARDRRSGGRWRSGWAARWPGCTRPASSIEICMPSTC